jgi:lipopolysaccharide export system protein LptA
MSTIRTLKIAATALALLALPTMGDAQTRPNSSDQPISFGADAGEYVGNTVTLRGRAELIQGDNRLRADTVSGLNQTGERSSRPRAMSISSRRNRPFAAIGPSTPPPTT